MYTYKICARWLLYMLYLYFTYYTYIYISCIYIIYIICVPDGEDQERGPGTGPGMKSSL